MSPLVGIDRPVGWCKRKDKWKALLEIPLLLLLLTAFSSAATVFEERVCRRFTLFM